jgi:Cu+-exporting ATPase
MGRTGGAHSMAIAIDPVCGMDVETEGAQLTFDYKGTTYYFCSRGCLLEFKDDPERFLAADHHPSM